jgi:hypothetical protein
MSGRVLQVHCKSGNTVFPVCLDRLNNDSLTTKSNTLILESRPLAGDLVYILSQLPGRN